MNVIDLFLEKESGATKDLETTSEAIEATPLVTVLPTKSAKKENS